MSTTHLNRFGAIDFSRLIERLTNEFTGREWLFQKLDDWLNQENGEKFYLLTGEPGVGKSAIAAQLIKRWIHEKPGARCFAAYHFCRAGDVETVRPGRVLRSLATQLGKTLPGYGEALNQVLDPVHLRAEVNINLGTLSNSQVTGIYIENLKELAPKEEFQLLIQAPLAALSNLAPPPGLKFFLIDSLDEAATTTGAENIVSLLASQYQTSEMLPHWVRFLLTSRPTQEVLEQFHPLQSNKIEELEEENLNDIQQYIQERMNNQLQDELSIFKPQTRNAIVSNLKPLQQRLEEADITAEKLVQEIKELSKGNFLYTKLLVNSIVSGEQSIKNLAALPKDLNEVYHRTLRYRCSFRGWLKRYQPILGTLSVTQEPINQEQLSKFIGTTPEEMKKHLDVLRQFLDESKDDQNQSLYTIFHQSLRDYLLDKKHNQDFWCNPQEQHEEIIQYYHPVDAGSWDNTSWENIDQYGLLYLPIHLQMVEQKSELYQLLTGSPKWMEAKSNAFGNAAYVDDLNLAMGNFADPVEEPTNLITLVKLHTARQVIHQRVTIPNLRTLVHLGREVEARSYARLSTDPQIKFDSLLLIYHALQELGRSDLALLDEAHQVTEKFLNKEAKAEALIQLASILFEAKSDKSTTLLDEAAKVIEEIEDNYERTEALIHLAEVLAYVGHFTEAEKVALVAEKTASTIGSYRAKAEALIEIAEVLVRIERGEKAKCLFHEAETIADQDEDGWRRAHALTKLASAIARTGLSHADDVFQKAEEVIDTILDYWQQVDRMIKLLIALAQAQRKNEARSILGRIISILSAIDEDDEHEQRLLNQLAVALAQIGEFSIAGTVAKEIKNVETQVGVFSELATLAHAKDDEKARDFFLTKARRIVDGIEEGWNKVTALNKLAAALEATNNFSEAENIVPIAEKVEFTVKEAWRKSEILSKLATVLVEAEHDAHQVNAVFREAQKAAYSLEENFTRVRAMGQLVVALAQSGKTTEAIFTDSNKVINNFLRNEKQPLASDEMATASIKESVAKESSFKNGIEKATEAIQKDDVKKSQVLIQLVTDLAQAQKFPEAEQIANALQESRSRSEAQGKLAIEFVRSYKFSEAERVIQAIVYEPAKSIPLSKLAAALAQAGDKRADAIFNEVERISFSLIENDSSNLWGVIELVAALAKAKRFTESRRIADLIEEKWAKVIALSQIARTYALDENFSKAETITKEAISISRETKKNLNHLWMIRALAKTLAHIKYFNEAFNLSGLKETPSDFLAILIYWQLAFEQIESGLLAKILKESIYILSWEHLEWREIVTILFNPKP